MGKKKRYITDEVECKGNFTTIQNGKKHQLHGPYEFQAITSPNPEKNGSTTDINLDQVIEAKAFVDQNHK